MRNFKLIYDANIAKENIENIELILKQYKVEKINKIEYKKDKNYILKESDIVLLYLEETQLSDVILIGVKKKWNIGILPHPNSGNILIDFGISNKMEEAIEDVLNNKINQFDLMLCNKLPVFKAVNIGDMFMLNKIEEDKNILQKIIIFCKKIISLTKKVHTPYQLSFDDKTIETCAFGIAIVEHSGNSIVSKRLVGDTYMNDETVHTAVLAPRCMYEMLIFLMISIFTKKKLKKMPEFVGYIKTKNIKIKSKNDINFTIDGKKLTEKELEIEVLPVAINVIQGRNIKLEEKNANINIKNTQQTKYLPVGEAKDELTIRPMPFFRRATTEEFKELFKVIRENAEVTSHYMVMLILATLVAVLGLFSNSAPVIIGAMILAPLMSPIVSVAMAIVRNDVKLLKTSFNTLLTGTIGALSFAFLLTFFIPLKAITPEINARLSPNILDLGVAIAAGIAAAYATSKEQVAKSIAGVAIAVALVPPLSVAGIGIGWLNISMFTGAFLLYLTNLAGIILAAGISFLVLGFAPFHRAKKGLLYIFFAVLVLSIPLSYSFRGLVYETKIKRGIENIKINKIIEKSKIIISDVQVRKRKKVEVKIKLVSSEFVTNEEKEIIFKEIEKIIKKSFSLEIEASVLMEK